MSNIQETINRAIQLTKSNPRVDNIMARQGAGYTAFRAIPQDILQKVNAPQSIQRVYKSTLGVPDSQYQAAVSFLQKKPINKEQLGILKNASVAPITASSAPQNFYGITKTPFGKKVSFDPQTVKEVIDFVNQHYVNKKVVPELEQAIPYTMQKAGAVLPKTRGTLAKKAVDLLNAIRSQNPNLMYSAEKL